MKSPSEEGDRNRGGDLSHATPRQNIFDSYKMFLAAVDSIIFPPKSRDRLEVIDYSV